MMMKIKATILGIAGLIFSGCFFANDEIKLDDIGNFKITVNEAEESRQVHLTGLLGDSAMGISDIKTTSHNDELNITLFQPVGVVRHNGGVFAFKAQKRFQLIAEQRDRKSVV